MKKFKNNQLKLPLEKITCYFLKLKLREFSLLFFSLNIELANAENLQKNSIDFITSRNSASSFDLTIFVEATSPVTSDEIHFTLNNATHSEWKNIANNRFKTTITSDIPSGEVSYNVTIGSASKSGKALILPNINENWEQPEPVPGEVNTDGWEDSPEISPDGNYLIVSTYSPVSIYQCILDGNLRTAKSCNQNSFSDFSSYRPDFPGANRIQSPHSINHNMALLDPPDTKHAFPPVSAYVFRQNATGFFTNGKPIYIDWQAYTWGAPFGFTFKKSISDSIYQIYLSFGDPILKNGNKLQSIELDLSKKDLKLGAFSGSGSMLQKNSWKMTPLKIEEYSEQAGNPFSTVNSSENGYLFWDNETLPNNKREIFFANETSDGIISHPKTVGLANTGHDKYQPYFFNNRLYYSFLHGLILSQELLSKNDLSKTENWGAVQVEIGIDTAHSHSGKVASIGEPSLYIDKTGKKWLYFAYSIQENGKNIDLNIGQVREK